MALLVAILLAVFVVPSPWGIVLVIGGALLEIGEATIMVGWSRRLRRRLRPKTGAEAMIGKEALVARPCTPIGQVKVNGEIWEARCDEGADPGESVRIEQVDGLMLVVARVDPAGA